MALNSGLDGTLYKPVLPAHLRRPLVLGVLIDVPICPGDRVDRSESAMFSFNKFVAEDACRFFRGVGYDPRTWPRDWLDPDGLNR